MIHASHRDNHSDPCWYSKWYQSSSHLVWHAWGKTFWQPQCHKYLLALIIVICNPWNWLTISILQKYSSIQCWIFVKVFTWILLISHWRCSRKVVLNWRWYFWWLICPKNCYHTVLCLRNVHGCCIGKRKGAVDVMVASLMFSFFLVWQHKCPNCCHTFSHKITYLSWIITLFILDELPNF